MTVKKINKDIVLKNGLIIDPFRQKTFQGSIWVKNGRIAGVGDFEIPDSDDVHLIDCTKKIITHAERAVLEGKLFPRSDIIWSKIACVSWDIKILPEKITIPGSEKSR